MEDLTLRYFDAEMRYLREAAKEFAQTHPDRAAMLDLDKAGTPDPYVERLFEGFAFSMGRLHEKIDDDLPELTESLVSMLWPHYLRTIPSLSVVALSPDVPAMKMAETLSAGLEISSRPVGPKNTVCRYRTTRDLTLNPLAVEKVIMTTEPDGRSLLRVRFACSTQADWPQTDLRQRWCEFTSLKSVRRLTVLTIRRCSPVTVRPLKPILWRKRISACALANR